ncbi:hypothetical protein F3Y22_tig00110926pilonHSYRG00112 [Hibiscus syriacus]|uniref:Uncharacterized protein n=1 Tax=Hibiscus syriacus TaxID=106335 RepID=A0A6A2ZF24_HIBSY|nr:hypothetical protein F3Y22_tig00110926pilonHSYRG00112 [Hibiscus syriacus]
MSRVTLDNQPSSSRRNRVITFRWPELFITKPASRLWLFSFPSLAWSSPVTPEPNEPPLVSSRATANLSSSSVIHSDPQQFLVKEGEGMLLGSPGPSGRRASSRASLLATASSAGSLSPMRGV